MLLPWPSLIYSQPADTNRCKIAGKIGTALIPGARRPVAIDRVVGDRHQRNAFSQPRLSHSSRPTAGSAAIGTDIALDDLSAMASGWRNEEIWCRSFKSWWLDRGGRSCDLAHAWRRIWQSRRQANCSLELRKLPPCNISHGAWRREGCCLAPASALPLSRFWPLCCMCFFRAAPSSWSPKGCMSRRAFNKTWRRGLA
jgi:hypothetical protein